MAKEKIEPELVEHSGLGRVKLDFAPSNLSFKVPPGVSVFDAASWNGIAIDSTCGGHGTCKKCKVQITEGIVPISRLDIRAFSQEELKNGWRLACVARATENLAITVPAMTTRPKAATVGVGRQVILRPAVQKRYLELEEPTLHDQRPDIQRVKDAIDDLEVNVEFHVLQKLPLVLRKNNFKVTAVIVDDLLIDIEPGDTTDKRFAIAYDLGTTTVVATLLDLNSGTPVAVKSMLNMQQPFLSSNLNSSIFFNTFFSGFSLIKFLVLGVVFNNKSDSGILEILTPPISVDKIGFLSGFSTIIVSVKISFNTSPNVLS